MGTAPVRPPQPVERNQPPYPVPNWFLSNVMRMERRGEADRVRCPNGR